MIIELGDEEETAKAEPPAPTNGERRAANGRFTKKADDAAKKAKKKEAKAEKKEAKADDAERAAKKKAEKAEKEAKKAAKAKKKAEKAKQKAENEAKKQAAKEAEEAEKKAARAEKEAKKAAKAEREAKRDDDKKRKLTFESFLGRDEAVAYFEQVLAGLSEGSVELRQGENGLSLSPGVEVEFELTASQKGKKEKLSIEFSWRAEKGDADLSIES